MKTITTRDLVHRTREIRESLERGESFQWSQRGRIVAVLQSMARPEKVPPIEWVGRAREAGAIIGQGVTVGDLISEQRDR